MIPRALRKSAEFLARQLALALDDMTEIRKTPRNARAIDPIRKARALIAEALRLIDRNSQVRRQAHRPHDARNRAAYVGQPELWKIGTALC